MNKLRSAVLVLLLLVCVSFSTTASAQIRVLNPFGSSSIHPFAAPQGTVTALTAADVTCSLPAAPLSTGLQPKPFSWNGYKWNNDSGQTWNNFVPYAISVCSNGHVKFELHDTTYDHGQSDPSSKRRAEIGATATAEKFHNHTNYWLAFSVLEHWDNPLGKTELRIGQPLHWPSGASPAVGITVLNINGQIMLRITTCGDDHTNHVRAQVPYVLDAVHDFVLNVTPDGSHGLLNVWMDGKQILAIAPTQNIPVGSNTEDGYTFRLGSYNSLNGNRAVEEIGNIAPFPSSADLSGRIAAPPAW